MTLFAAHPFYLSHTLTLKLSRTRTFTFTTTLQLPAASTVVLYEWLLYGYTNFTSPQSPNTAQTVKLKTWVFIHTVYTNFTNEAFIHTGTQISQSKQVQKPP